MVAENTGLEVEIGVTLERLTKQLALAEARMIKAAKKSEDAFEKSNGRAAASFRKIDVAAERTGGVIGRIGGGIAGAFAGGFAVGAVTQAFDLLRQSVAGTLQELGDLADTSDRVGIDTESLQGLQRGFGLAGVEVADLNKGLEQFTRRIGDAARGGDFAKTLDRYNIALRDQQGQIRPVLDLLKDYANVVKALPEAQQLAVAQDAFGRGGVGLVNGLREGGEGLQQFITDAREAGSVIDDELVRKAEEIGDRYDALALRLKVFWQTQIVGAAEFVEYLGSAKTKIDEIATGSGRSPADLIGPEAAANLRELGEVSDETTGLIQDLDATAQGAAFTAKGLGLETAQLAENLRLFGQTEAADALSNISTEMLNTIAQFERGDITAGEFADRLIVLQGEATTAASAVDDIDQIDFANVIGRLGGLGGVLAGVAEIARSTAAAVALAINPTAGLQQSAEDPKTANARAAAIRRAANEGFIGEQTRINGLTREQIALEREVAEVREKSVEAGAQLSEQQIKDLAAANIAAEAARSAASKGGGASGGGSAGKAAIDERAKVLELGLKQLDQLEFEASLLGKTAEEAVALTAAHQMLNAAKQAGLNLDERSAATGMTLREEIEGQAAAIGRLTSAYDLAQQKAEFFEDITGQLKDGLIDAIVAGEDFQGVLASIAQAIAKAALQAALFGQGPLAGLFGGTAGSGLLTGLLPFAEGGYTGAGGKYEPKGVVHGGEFVFSKDAVRRIGVRNLEAMHSQLKGFAGGGYVGASPSAAPAAAPKVDVVIIDDESRFGEYLSQDPRAERAILQVVNRNGIGRAG